uniref:Phosphatidylinositol transfer protein N-terminal domain-containing protein n=1 Tax=Chrysemys picta bellii TaxID=8478 RepID=A0A8C3FEF5_CHRPI
HGLVLEGRAGLYQVGQLFAVAEASKNNTGGGEGIEVVTNEPYERLGEAGQYTHKIYHLHSKVPAFVKMLAPEGSLVFHEKAWNAYPYCRTGEVMVNRRKPGVQGPDSPTLCDNWWQRWDVLHPVDGATNCLSLCQDYKADEDPALFTSVKTGRGPLGPDWKRELGSNQESPHMCAYKLVTVNFRWWGLQGRMEKFIHKQEQRLFTNFNRQVFCWLDKWVDLSMADIRRMEEETQKELDEMRQNGAVRGMAAGDE